MSREASLPSAADSASSAAAASVGSASRAVTSPIDRALEALRTHLQTVYRDRGIPSVMGGGLALDAYTQLTIVREQMVQDEQEQQAEQAQKIHRFNSQIVSNC